MSYYLYVIRSGNSQYVGITRNLKDRIGRHNARQSKSTKHKKDWEVVCFEKYNTLSEARKAEIILKKKKVSFGA